MSAAFVLLASMVCAGAVAEQGKPPLNVLVVLSDDHSAPHLGCYGNKEIRTPNLDRFAAEGMRFDRAYVACPQCVPSRAAVMTGRSPVAIGMTRFTAPLPADVKTYPEYLRETGYHTGVAGRNFHLDGGGGPQTEMGRVLVKHQLKTFANRFDYVKVSAGGPNNLRQYREFLDTVPQGKPFFLQLCFNDPHRPLDDKAVDPPHDPAKLTLPRHYPDTPAVRADFSRYYDEISRMDGHFGEVLAELKKRGLDDRTIVLFMGDNGSSQWRGKGTLYEFGIHVPLLVRWPGVVRPGSSAELISGEDIGPTLLEACGRPVPKEMTGKSFAKLLRGEPYQGREYVFAERGAHGSAPPGTSNAFDLGRVVVTKTHKLIYNALFHLPYEPVDFAGTPMWTEVRKLAKAGKLPAELIPFYDGRQRAMVEVFDLEHDPAELTNLAGKPEVAAVEKKLRAALVEWMILEHDFLPLPLETPRALK